MLYLKLIVIAVIWTYSNFAHASNYGGFDEICQIYAEARSGSLTGEKLSKYIFDNVSARVTAQDAIEAHEAIFNAAPEDRYSIFIQSAEISLGKAWDCPAIGDLLK